MRTFTIWPIKAALVCAFIGLGVQTAAAQDKQFNENFKQFLKTEEGQEAVVNALQDYEWTQQFKNVANIEIGASPVKGPANAPVTVIEFSDFECPYCSRGKETMDQLAKLYPNDVKIVFKNLPLPFHRNAKPAALAALAAGKQGKFWEFHDALFSNQKGLNDQFYTETATKLGLNMDKFKTDLADPELSKLIDKDTEAAKANGISGTPGFFVNGVAVKGAYPITHFQKLVDGWLKKGSQKG